MTPLLTIALVLAIIAIAYTVTITLAWGLIHGAALIRRDETHYRADGPVSIDPHRKHRIHIRGDQ